MKKTKAGERTLTSCPPTKRKHTACLLDDFSLRVKRTTNMGIVSTFILLKIIMVETHRSVPRFPWITEVTPGNDQWGVDSTQSCCSLPMLAEMASS